MLALIVVLSVRALAEDVVQNIEIKAERVELDHNAGTMTYFGNVRANQGSMRITANRMRADYEDRTIKRITACGNPARYQQLLEADKGLLRANAQTIVYHTHEEQVDLEGEAHLRQGGNEIVGGFIHYDIVAGRINAESGEDGPVTVTVQPPRQNRKP